MPLPPAQLHRQQTSVCVPTMTSRLGQRAGAAISLVALLVLLWTVVVVKQQPPPLPTLPPATAEDTSKGNYFQESQLLPDVNSIESKQENIIDTRKNIGFNRAINVPAIFNYPVREKNYSKVQCDKAEKDNHIEYVIPLKIHTLHLHEDDLRYGADDWSKMSDKPESSKGDPFHFPGGSNHFRHRHAVLWDPHPQYTFCAFGQFFHLLLEENSKFVSPQLHVTHLWHNYTQRESVTNAKCFYTGHVHGDPKSSVAVSLCHGMTGHIRTSVGNYLIQPAESWLQHNESMIHEVLLIQPRNGMSNSSASSRHCGLEGSKKNEYRNESMVALNRSKRALRITPTGRRGKPLSRREYFVEVMVVADKKMAEYHGGGLNDYVLTLMSIVAKLFKDPSIGNPISVAVVKLVVLRDLEFVQWSLNERGRRIGTSATEMRKTFCAWQKDINVLDDSNPDHHDTALLLTRENICRDPRERKCDTLGLAEIGTVCDMNSSCAIVQDNGLSAAFTIAHEFGHVLNMPHDDAEECRIFRNAEKYQNVMSRMLDSATSPWSWSNCSRHFLTEFLEAGHGACLMDSPTKDYIMNIYPGNLPGENFTADRQCELVLGHGYRLCSYMPVCQHLWCSQGGGEREGCLTKHMPWADGTTCGNGSWCQRGTCVIRDPHALIPVDGGWGGWNKFGECSRSCGGGIKRATRECNNPPPANGGGYCIGRRMKFQSCNTEDCPKGSKDFREEQCAAFNNNTFGHNMDMPRDVKWVPKYGVNKPEERCQLYCRVMNTPTYYKLMEKVIDGTPCGPDTFDVCVNGICKPAGCDHLLGSKAKLDVCGRCNGKNASCHLVTGTFNESTYGYNVVVKVPVGSINLEVQQIGHQGSSNDSNYLALMDESGDYILNGGNVLTMYHNIISINGTKLEYTGINAVVERLNATKPLKRDLIIQILSVGKLYPPNITYKYIIRCQWRTRWTECSKSCIGVAYKKPYCSLLDRNEEIHEKYCSKMAKPKVIEKPCTGKCKIRWQLTTSECSVRCGRGYRNVTAHCIVEISSNEVQHIDNKECAHLEPPPEYEECEVSCAHWKFGDWGSCTKTCGGGYQHRLAECVGNRGEPVNESLCSTHQRVTTQKCANNNCPSWRLGDWTPCSVSCGTGERHRPYWCNQDDRIVSPQFCNSQLPPLHRETCSLACAASWQQM